MTTQQHTWRRSALIGVIVAATMLTIGVLGVLVSGEGAPPAVPNTDGIRLVAVPGGVAATSTWHGPRVVEAGRASGFTHDELGAAIAASNLAPRITLAAGPDVTGPTLAEQCWGDTRAVSEQLAAALPRPDVPDRADLSPSALYFRVLAGDPNGEHVVVSLLADTGQARDQGGYSRMDLTLRWTGTDWQLRVPTPRPSLHPTTADYTLLGPTP